MTEHGLVDVPDASARFLVDRRADATGSAVAAVVEGTRPMLVEVQALVVPTSVPPRRYATGLDAARIAMLLGVLTEHGGARCAQSDVYASVAGGLRVTETGADLALALAVASAQVHRPVVAGAVAIGELGLGGEVRTVPQVERRLDEAARLGFTVALVPANGSSTSAARGGIHVEPVRDVTDALERGLG